MIIEDEKNKKQLSQKEIRDLNWKPRVVKILKPKNKLTCEQYLARNLKGFMRFMVEYADE